MNAFDQAWYEWLECTTADGTGIHSTPDTEVYQFWANGKTNTRQDRKQLDTEWQLPEHHEAAQISALSYVHA